jgi:hypothetical protein
MMKDGLTISTKKQNDAVQNVSKKWRRSELYTRLAKLWEVSCGILRYAMIVFLPKEVTINVAYHVQLLKKL